MSEDRNEVVVRGDGEGLHHEVLVGSHRLSADEPECLGGPTGGPTPTTCCSPPSGRARR